jgi:hypothetical protein
MRTRTWSNYYVANGRIEFVTCAEFGSIEKPVVNDVFKKKVSQWDKCRHGTPFRYECEECAYGGE